MWGDGNTTCHTIDGAAFTATDPTDLMTQLRADSFNPEQDLKAIQLIGIQWLASVSLGNYRQFASSIFPATASCRRFRQEACQKFGLPGQILATILSRKRPLGTCTIVEKWESASVRTTIERPDPLFREVKATAARQGKRLKNYISEALQDKLAKLPISAEKPWMRFAGISMFGELPSWALFLRHTRGIVLRQSRFDLKSPDFRPALVLDRSVDTELNGISLDNKSGSPLIAAHASPGIRILNPSQPLGKDDLRQWETEPATH